MGASLRSRFASLLLFAVLLALLMIFGIDAVGLLSVDEPRYAAIGREMAYSGDFITPRLWGEAWFEKPPLLFWMIGAATWLGLEDEWAVRLPVALLSIGFVAFLHGVTRREFGPPAALYSMLILAGSAGWIAYSQIGATDLPLAASFGAAVLLWLPWAARGEKRGLKRGGAMLGLAALAKGLVAFVLVLPLLWHGRRRLKELVPSLAVALAVAFPWYGFCYAVNGSVFVEEFIWKHHVERFASEALQHQQPFWFYIPVLAAGLLPWTPAVAALRWSTIWSDVRLRLLGAIAVWGLVFFSAATNKLPGYLLPLLPPIAILLGVALANVRQAGILLAICAALLGLIPIAASILPEALLDGLSRVRSWNVPMWGFLPPAGVAIMVWLLERERRRDVAMTLLFVAVVAGVLYLKVKSYPVLDEEVSARGLWRRIEAVREQVCVGDLGRHWEYGLNYYAVQPLASCEEQPREWRLRLNQERRPVLEASLSY